MPFDDDVMYNMVITEMKAMSIEIADDQILWFRSNGFTALDACEALGLGASIDRWSRLRPHIALMWLKIQEG